LNIKRGLQLPFHLDRLDQIVPATNPQRQASILILNL
jgi:hypothetical protein